MKVVIISGPTATGKTDLAVELAKKHNGEVVNFDSLLLYKEINIGTAKPTPQEQKEIAHHMINVRSISDPMNAADYSRTAFPIVQEIHSRGKIPFLTGGSGFYLQALIKGMYDSPTTPPDILRRSDHLYQNSGIKPFLDILKENDQESFKRYHENDHYRIRRAVEHFWTTGGPLSKARASKDETNQKMERPTIHEWDIFHIYLDMPKEEHLKIIEKRTDRMLEHGLIDEVKSLLTSGFSGMEKPLQSIGYKESLNFIFGVYKNLKECRDRIIISTRQLAKSQRTWFNRDVSKVVFHPLEERQNIFLQVEEFLKN